MNDIVKVAVTGIVASVCALVLRKQVPELSALLVLCAGLVILVFNMEKINLAAELLREIGERSGVTKNMVAPVLKVTGITIITRLSSEFCRDAKEGTLASVVEGAGGLAALMAAFPLMTQVLEMISNLL